MLKEYAIGTELSVEQLRKELKAGKVLITKDWPYKKEKPSREKKK